MPVTHCLCERRSFADVLRWARERGGAELRDVERELGCGKHCGICRPFIEYALATGQPIVPWPCPDIPEAACKR